MVRIIRKIRSIRIIFLLVFVLLAKAGFVFADAAQDLSDGISTAFKWGIGAGILLSACVIAFGGILWVAQFAKGSFRQDSIEWIKAGLAGLLVTMCSWLIIYTINPDILNFDIKKLFPKTISYSGGGGNIFQPQIIDYDEIPIGMLTENLLTKKVNCYDFDAQGDPIAGEEIEDKNGENFLGPTYLNHDRVDCYIKLAGAIEKKTKLAANLSREMNKLLNTCSCQTYGKCKDCNNANASNPPATLSASWIKTAQECKLKNAITETDKTGGGACVGCCTDSQFGKNGQTACQTGSQASGLVSTSCLKPGAGNEPDLSCCDPNKRSIINGYVSRHGDHEAEPIKVYGADFCDTTGVSPKCVPGSTGNISHDYYGLDEFYTEKSLEDIKEKIEKTAETEEYGQIIYIDLDSCPTCIFDCNYQCQANDSQCQKDQQKCIEDQKTCIEKDRPECLKKTEWGKLNLIEQITYLNGKLTELKEGVSADLESLKSASLKLSNCHLAKSYIDLNQTDEQTDANATLLRIFYGDADISNYCDGFNYANSSCYKQCSEMCPITEEDVKNHYSKCKACDINDSNYNQCKKELDTCVNNYYNSEDRKCEKWEGTGGDKTFKNCLSTCENNCKNDCSIKYLECSEEFEACKSACGHDSKCVLENVSSCILNSNVIRSCTENNNSEDVINMCIENSYTCKAGSEQNSGYPDCLLYPTQEDKFSSSFLYENPEKQRCYWPPSQSTREALRINCAIRKHLEIRKCPVGSPCPECKCDALESQEQSLDIPAEKKLNPKELNPCKNEGDPSNGGVNNSCEKISDDTPNSENYRITGAECIKPAYNDDPLTFYCRFDWWYEKESERTEPIAKSMSCGKAGQIPVGVLVDDAVKWADDFIKQIEKVQKASQGVVDIAEKIKRAGSPGSKDKYCQCASKYESGNPICRACCEYISVNDPRNNTPKPKEAYCNFKPCSVNSCQQLINWLEQIIDYHTDIKTGLVSSLLGDPRSDVLKELTYSRKQVNSCSGQQNIIGAAKARMLSCQRAYDDIIPDIVKVDEKIIIDKQEIYHSCYGTMVGEVFSKPIIMDNWFCCTTVHAATAEEKAEKTVPGVGLPWSP